MNNKSGHVIRIILGAYLVYLGVRILIQVIKTEPSNSEIMGVLSVLFAIIGGGYVIFSIRKFIKAYKSENAKNSGVDETQELNIPENIGDIRKSDSERTADKNKKSLVEMQQVGPAENTSAAEMGTDKEEKTADVEESETEQ